MNVFPENIKFKYPWRKYQKRVLDELEKHLDDDHLHIIAPPGSGKTVLGLEVMLRLNKPTLIFAPTVALRNQWENRFYELFLQTSESVPWISTNIRKPQFLTVLTYQSLHAALSGEKTNGDDEEEDAEENSDYENKRKRTKVDREILKQLLAQQYQTIVVDEAHHLKNEWWKSLILLKKELQDIVVVGLTATPPYDVAHLEWQRYEELNGPVDAEISVPELVVEKNLCPHQDYIYCTAPTDEEHEKIIEHRQRIDRLIDGLLADNAFIQDITSHRFVKAPNDYLEKIYNKPEYYASMLVFLHEAGTLITEAQKSVLGNEKEEIPSLTYEWMEILLNGYLYEDDSNLKLTEEKKEKLFNRIKKHGGLERKQVNLRENHKTNRFLTSSISKLNGIEEITNFEFANLKHELRLVILTDYIRKEFLSNETHNHLPLTKIGVVPIFEKLRRNNHDNKQIAVLTGSLVIIPTVCKKYIEAELEQENSGNINFSPLPYDADYSLVAPDTAYKDKIVHNVTHLLQNGHIQVLIGTKSLLGEGWDAPSINSLILASFVGSYVSSNQMRGRAIRTSQDNPHKTSNIWHLACIDKALPNGGDDIELMKRRFKAFVGVNYSEEARIENGVSRLELPEKNWTDVLINENNSKSFEFASQRVLLQERWNDALKTGNILVEEIKVKFPPQKSYPQILSKQITKSVKSLTGVAGSGFLLLGEKLVDFSDVFTELLPSPQAFGKVAVVAGAVGSVVFLRKLYKDIKNYFSYRDITKDIDLICEVIILTLKETGELLTDLKEFKVVSSSDSQGNVYCYPKGGSTYEKSVFLKCLTEVIEPINNPRYIIFRKTKALNIIHQTTYHAIPEIFGVNKKSAEVFFQYWEYKLGKSQLIFARTIEGRQLLMTARHETLKGKQVKNTEHTNRWR